MATPWKTLEADWWSFLTGEATYTALSLNEFRGYDGVVLPWDPDTRTFPEHALPAIWTELAAVESGETDPAIWGQRIDSMTVDGALVFGQGVRDSIETAMDALVELHDSRANRQNHLGSASISDYTFRPGEVAGIRPAGSGRVMFWRWNFSVELIGNRRNIN